MYREVKFGDKFEDSPMPTHPIRGIGVFEDDQWIDIECGGYVEADDAWTDISNAIIGEG